MSYAGELAGLKDIALSVVAALVPAAAGNVYVPDAEMPNGIYEGTYPYIALHAEHLTATELGAGGGPERGNDDGDPNMYILDYVDQLVSESGSTLAATYTTLIAFADAFTDAFNARPVRTLNDGGNNKRADAAGETVTFQLNPAGVSELASNQPSIVIRGRCSVKGLHRYPTS